MPADNNIAIYIANFEQYIMFSWLLILNFQLIALLFNGRLTLNLSTHCIISTILQYIAIYCSIIAMLKFETIAIIIAKFFAIAIPIFYPKLIAVAISFG